MPLLQQTPMGRNEDPWEVESMVSLINAEPFVHAQNTYYKWLLNTTANCYFCQTQDFSPAITNDLKICTNRLVESYKSMSKIRTPRPTAPTSLISPYWNT